MKTTFRLGSLLGPLRAEWKLWLPLALACALVASCLMSGFPGGIVPDLSVPYSYTSDGVGHVWVIRRLMEGSLWDNPRSGWPFGSDYLDYPGADGGSHLAIRLFGAFLPNDAAIFNFYFLLGFPLAFAAAYGLWRSLGLEKRFATASAVLFAFLPYHLDRTQHLLLTWYFTVPVYLYFALNLYFDAWANEKTGFRNLFSWRNAVAISVFAVFGVYYALFGALALGFAGILAWIRTGNLRPLVQGLVGCCLIVFGVLINVSPSLIHRVTHGKNPEVATRHSMEAEHYGFKMMQLVLPRQEHRAKRLAEATRHYSRAYPLVNENAWSALGLLGAIGFGMIGFFLLASVVGKSVDERLRILSLFGLVSFLFGTIGGLGALFSLLVSASFRGWNRISVLVGLVSLGALFFWLQLTAEDRLRRGWLRKWAGSLAPLLLIYGVADQTFTRSKQAREAVRAEFEADRQFVSGLESALAPGSAIYQLPYMGFPEVPPVHGIHSYESLAGFIHSRKLNWSFGGMKGRQGDLFYRALAAQPLSVQVQVARKMGFSGLYFDKRGFADGGVGELKDLTRLLGEPERVRPDGLIAFFRLTGGEAPNWGGKGWAEIMEAVGFKPPMPSFVR